MINRCPENERIKRHYVDYLKHADGKSDATIRQIEKAILRYEEFTGFADFKTFDQQQAKSFKVALAEHDLAKATILSAITALKRFFGWLACQPGYKSRIPLTDIDYLSLSEKDVRAAKAPAIRNYPTLEQIERTISLMPSDTDIEKRDRAVVAFTILTGARDGAIISLRIKHVDVQRMLLVQHPKEVATKFNKRIDTYFFPVGDTFENIVIAWIKHLREELLFGENDPLFPKTAMSQDEDDCFITNGLTREFWSNASPIRKFFRAAFARAGLPNFTPHSFRSTLVQIAYQRKLSAAELKAWSQNLGHESVLTTFTSYGNIDVEQQGDLVRNAMAASSVNPLTKRELEEILNQRGL